MCGADRLTEGTIGIMLFSASRGSGVTGHLDHHRSVIEEAGRRHGAALSLLMRPIRTGIVVGLFVAVIVLCGFDGTNGHELAPEQDAAHHHSSPCSILSGCQAESLSGGVGIPRLVCEGPLPVSTAPQRSWLIPQLIDHPPEFSA